MPHTNPPQERATTASDIAPTRSAIRLAEPSAGDLMLRRQVLMQHFAQETDHGAHADVIGLAAWRFLNAHEPDAKRRAAIWLVGRRFIDEPSASLDPRIGTRSIYRWIRAMCRHDRQP